MSPAQVPKTGRPPAWNFSRAGTNPQASISLSSVVLSPPGTISPSRSSSCSGLRTSTTSTPVPHPASARACRAKSPCNASTPIFTAVVRSPSSLPAACLQQVLFGHLGDLQSDHRVAEVLAHLHEHVGILEVRRRLHDGLGAAAWIGRLDDAAADAD